MTRSRLPRSAAMAARRPRSPLPLFSSGLFSSGLATKHCVVDYQHDDRSDYCDDHAIEIETGDPTRAEEAEDKAPDDGPNNAEYNVEEKASPDLLTILLAMNPAIRPKITHAIIDITHLFCSETCPGQRTLHSPQGLREGPLAGRRKRTDMRAGVGERDVGVSRLWRAFAWRAGRAGSVRPWRAPGGPNW